MTTARAGLDRCPGLSRPFIADDGALVRLRVPGGQISTAVLRDLIDLAARFGAPYLQLTSRGNLQLRALPEPLPREFVQSAEATGLLPSASHELVRNILAAPLAPHLSDLVREFDKGLCADPELAHLPGRFMVAFSDENGSVLGERWDLAYQQTSPNTGRVLAAGMGLDVAPHHAVAELLRLARAFLAHRSSAEVWNVRDLAPGAALFEGMTSMQPILAETEPVALGVHGDDLVCGVPLGMLDVVMLDALAGATDTVVLTPWRSVVVLRSDRYVGAQRAASELGSAAAQHLADSGLTITAGSAWEALSACVGAPSCGRTTVATMALAREAVVHLPSDAARTHVSGCERRCGAPAQAHVDVLTPTSARQIIDAAQPQTPTLPTRAVPTLPTRAVPTLPTRAVPTLPTPRYDYVRDGLEIYRRSFGMIRDEATLAGLDGDLATVATRIMHASGDVGLVKDIAAHPDVIEAAREALRAGHPILTDSNMLASGITWRRLPSGNAVICTLRNEQVPTMAKAWRTTRAAAAVSLWEPHLEGAVVAIGNAPTALFHLLEMLHDGAPRPAAIIGMPVGFIGSAESKVALAEHELADGFRVPWIVLHGRRGGSAVAASAVNAIATPDELA